MPTIEMVLHYDHRLISRGGRSVAFKKDVPVQVHDDMVEECVALGARRVDNKPATAPKLAPERKAQPSGTSRKDAIIAALQVLKEENDSKKFAGTGRPKVSEVSKMAGFQADAQEVAKLWDEMDDGDSEDS